MSRDESAAATCETLSLTYQNETAAFFRAARRYTSASRHGSFSERLDLPPVGYGSRESFKWQWFHGRGRIHADLCCREDFRSKGRSAGSGARFMGQGARP